MDVTASIPDLKRALTAAVFVEDRGNGATATRVLMPVRVS